MYTSWNYRLYKTLTRAGVLNGLQLVVNVEQYEYMKGPHAAVGLKVLLHEQGAIPMVENFAVAVPVGMNTFIAVIIEKVTPIYNHVEYMEPDDISCTLRNRDLAWFVCIEFQCPKNRNKHIILVRCRLREHQPATAQVDENVEF